MDVARLKLVFSYWFCALTHTISLQAQHPELVKDVSTGGAQPLHMCGMSRRGQMLTQTLIEAGADIEAIDTYGYRQAAVRVLALACVCVC